MIWPMTRNVYKQEQTDADSLGRRTRDILRALARLVLLVALGVEMHSAVAAEVEIPTAVMRDASSKLVLTPYAAWTLEPEGETWTPEQAAQRFAEGAFTPAPDRQWLELGLSDRVHWLAVNVRNELRDTRLVLEFRNPRMSYIDLYVGKPDGTFRRQRSGTGRDFDIRRIRSPMPSFPIRIAPNSETTLLLRCGNVGDFRTRLWLWTAPAFMNRALSAYYFELMAVGVFGVLAFLQLMTFISLREPGYGYLFFFIIMWMLFLMAGNGIGYMLLWEDWPWLSERANSIFFIFMCASFVLFAMSFLDARRYTPWLYRAGMTFCAICLAHFAYTSITESVIRLHINRILGIGVIVLSIALVAQSIRKGNRRAIFFFASWVFMMAASILLLLFSLYVLPATVYTVGPLVSILVALSVVLWSFELTSRVRARAKEQRRLLEEQVADRTLKLSKRTEELQHALSQVKTLSGLLPICSSCKKIRDDSGYWRGVEHYVAAHTDADFTHSLCPDCYTELYPELAERRRNRGEGGSAPA